MITNIESLALIGYDANLVRVEVDLKNSEKGSLQIIGLPDTAVKESRERVKAALENIGFSLAFYNGVINLAPGDIKKEGASYDLAMALGVLLAKKPSRALDGYIIIGELSLSGEIRPVKGALAYALQAKALGMKGIILPEDNLAEVRFLEDFVIIGLSHLKQAFKLFENPLFFAAEKLLCENETNYQGVDFADIKGQKHVKRALEVAAAGGHHLLLSGPPGIGKTLLSKALLGILPPLNSDEQLEAMRIWSLAHLPFNSSQRPFRSPHHSISNIGLIGGSQPIRPGEISLSHHGVLFLDEILEFKRTVLELLRQPMEDRQVTITRAKGTSTFPSKFLLVATMNPCPCGFHGHPTKRCKDTPKEIARYQAKLSGPLLDRIDMRLDVCPIRFEEYKEAVSESSAAVKLRVEKARHKQTERFGKSMTNQEMGPKEMALYCSLDAEGEAIVKRAQEGFSLSHRGQHKLLKVARTLADLEGLTAIQPSHLLEALTYREVCVDDAAPF